jgi:hypothetical protein
VNHEGHEEFEGHEELLFKASGFVTFDFFVAFVVS